MDIRIFLEWDGECGLSLDKIYPLREGVEKALEQKFYGNSIKEIRVILISRAFELKRRKCFKKSKAIFDYDIQLDYFLIKNVELEEKKKLITYQMIKITEDTLKDYKFEDFDKVTFFNDFRQIVNSVQW
jgi:hypothetical protein